MDSIIVDNSNNILSTTSNTDIVVIGSPTTETIVVTGLIGPKGKDGTLTALNTLSDVDITNIKDGSILIYSATNSKWIAETTLNNQILEAGQF